MFSREEDDDESHMDIIWVFFFAVQIVLDIPIALSPTSSREARRILFSIVREYHDTSTEGLTRNTVLELFSPLDPTIRTRLAYAAGKSVVSVDKGLFNNCKY